MLRPAKLRSLRPVIDLLSDLRQDKFIISI